MQALKLYRLDNGFYPSTDQGLGALVQRPTTNPVPGNWKQGGYLERLPKDPWGSDYQYLNPGVKGEIDVFSLGRRPGPRRRRQCRGHRQLGLRRRKPVGFTLIEVLVVVAIAGIVVALASVNLFPSDAQVARREAADVALAIESARDQAWFGGRPTAVNFADGQLRRWRYAGRAWEADSGRDHALRPGLRVTGLFVDGQRAQARRPDSSSCPTDWAIPFRVALDVRGLSWAVEGDAAGAVKAVAR